VTVNLEKKHRCSVKFFAGAADADDGEKAGMMMMPAVMRTRLRFEDMTAL